jgi:phosphate transport system permease protein
MFGLFGPAPFPTVLSGALTLGLLVLPVVIVATQEALRSVPPSLRHASLALGATQWQTIWHQVLPAAIPGIIRRGWLVVQVSQPRRFALTRA